MITLDVAAMSRHALSAGAGDAKGKVAAPATADIATTIHSESRCRAIPQPWY
jgi:hypothetical protein